MTTFLIIAIGFIGLAVLVWNLHGKKDKPTTGTGGGGNIGGDNGPVDVIEESSSKSNL
jgi:hypothetical protein